MPVRLMILDALLTLQECVFSKFYFLWEGFPFFLRGSDFLFTVYPLCQGFFRIFGNILTSFSNPAKKE